MTVTVNDIEATVWKIDREAPQPIVFWLVDSLTGVPLARAATLTGTLKAGAITITKTVGAGIVLSTQDGIANARVTMTIATADLSGFKDGNFTAVKFIEGTTDPKTLVFKGRLDIS